MNLLLLNLLLLFCSTSRARVMLYPDDGDVLTLCANDVLTVTCVADNGLLKWSFEGITKTFSDLLPSNIPGQLGNSIIVSLVSSSVESYTSVATVTEVQSNLNNTILSCSDGVLTKGRTFLIAGVPSKPSNLNFKAVNSTSVTIHWMPPVDNSKCIAHYVVYLENEDMIYNSTTTSLNVSLLEKDEEQLVKVAAVDRLGRVGENASILMNLTVPQRVKDLIVQTCDRSTLFASWKRPPSSSRPPVTHYTVQHNVTNSGSLIQLDSVLTSITISGAQPGRVYSIEVTAVNLLGPGPPFKVSVSAITAVNNLSVTTTVEQMQPTCSCAVELGVSLSICFLLMVAGCFLTAIIIIKKHTIVQIVTILLQGCKEKNSTFGSSSDPSMMNPNIAYEEQEPGYTETLHKYHNTNPTVVRVDCHVYAQPSKKAKDNKNCE